MSLSSKQLSDRLTRKIFKYLKKHPPRHCPFMEEVVDAKFCTMSNRSDCENTAFQNGCWELLIEQALGEVPVKTYVSKED